MFSQDFSMVVTSNGSVVKEESGMVNDVSCTVAKIPYNSNYTLRLKNKHKDPCCVDLYIDGKLVNGVGPLFLAGNSVLDVDQWVLKDKQSRKLLFVKINDKRVKDKNDCETGLVEARFYKAKEEVQKECIKEYISIPYYVPIYPYRTYPWYPYYPNIWWDRPYYWGDNYPWTVWCGGGGMCSSAGNFSNNNGLYNYSSCESKITFDNSNLNGATIQGEGVDEKLETSKFSNPFESEPVVLRLQLVGVDKGNKNILCCDSCGKKVEDRGQKFCSNCGAKLYNI